MIRSSSPPGFSPAEEHAKAAPVQIDPGRPLGGNPFIRCPLPPFNTDPDSSRQFNQNGKTPTRRVIPLPISTVAGTGSITNNTTVIQQGGSSSGGTTQAKLVAATVTLQIPALTPGGVFTATVMMSKSFQLKQLVSSGPLEFRVYGDAISQASDIVRSTDTAPPFEITPGLITDVVFDTAPFQWNWQNRTGANSDPVITANVYVTVVNPSTVVGSAAGQMSILYVPLEND